MDQQAPGTPQASVPPDPPPPAVQASGGWVQPSPPPPQAPSAWGQAPAGTTGWVMPQDAAARGQVTGLSKLGAAILIVFGALWTLIGLLFLLIGAGVNQLGDPEGLMGLTDLVGSVLIGVGVVILAIALVEIATGVFAWRGSGLARTIGILYGLVFGLITLAGGLGSTRDAASRSGSGFLLIFAVGYLYTAVVFILRWRQRA